MELRVKTSIIHSTGGTEEIRQKCGTSIINVQVAHSIIQCSEILIIRRYQKL